MEVDARTTTERQSPRWLFLAIFIPIFVITTALAILTLRWIAAQVLTGDSSSFRILTTIFLSIIIEAIPFILIGVFVSAIIQVFISEDTITRIIPKNRLLGIVLASLMGIIFPVCECGIVPVARRLMKKGVPASMGIAFLLAVPIINPVVMASTYFAFGGLKVALLRAGIAFAVSIIVALTVARSSKETPLVAHVDHAEECHDHACACSCAHEHQSSNTIWQNVTETLEHASEEFFQMGKFLIIGAFLAATLQVAISRDMLLSVGQSPISSTLSMMGLAYGLSLCSEADAFIAATFVKSFSLPSILGFLVYGPMLDIKQTMMLFSTFKQTLVLRLIATVTITVFLIVLLLSYFT